MNLLRLFFAQLLTTAMILAGVLMAFHHDWPDYVHTDYGVPLVWAVHTESAITGPVDIWRVDPTNLVANIAIWTVLSLALVTVIGILSRKRA
jgi:hypothetical protein